MRCISQQLINIHYTEQLTFINNATYFENHDKAFNDHGTWNIMNMKYKSWHLANYEVIILGHLQVFGNLLKVSHVGFESVLVKHQLSVRAKTSWINLDEQQTKCKSPVSSSERAHLFATCCVLCACMHVHRHQGPFSIYIPACLNQVTCEILTSVSTILSKSIFYLKVLRTYLSKELRFLKSAPYLTWDCLRWL